MLRLALLPAASAMLLAGTATGPPQAQEPPDTLPACMLAEELEPFLKETFEEIPIVRGVSSGGVLVTVFAAASTTTWTIAVTDPAGVSCIVAEGNGFELMQEEVTRRSGPAGT